MSQNESNTKKESGISRWWNSPKGKKTVNVVYSLGASVVIIGAMFKILHLPGANMVLGTGMICEAFIFSLGALDKPFKEYHWDRVFDFENGTTKFQTELVGSGTVSATPNLPHINYSETLSEEDIEKLSEGIKNLSATAQQLASVSDLTVPTSEFIRNIASASESVSNFSKNQNNLNSSLHNLSGIYEGIGTEMKKAEEKTKDYTGEIEKINKNLSSLNAIYEIHLKNVEEQSTKIGNSNKELENILSNLKKINLVSSASAEESEKYKNETIKLTQQVAELNHVYGNMLNALS
jgi:gliding motility-associated protein GldL